MNNIVDQNVSKPEITQSTLNSALDEILSELNLIAPCGFSELESKHDLWVGIYENTLRYCNVFELIQSVESFYNFEPSKIDLVITKPYRLSLCVYDLKLHNGFLFMAIYFSVNNLISNLCCQHGFKFFPKKHIWVKKVDVGDSCDLRGVMREGFIEFLKEISMACHIIVNKSTQEKLFSFNMVNK